jgi:hypothetical protein
MPTVWNEGTPAQELHQPTQPQRSAAPNRPKAADSQLENDKLRMQRKHINDANDALAAEDNSAPLTTKKPRLDAAVTQPKKDAREV